MDEDAAEGQDAAHDDARHGFGEEGLLRNLAWDLVCSHWWLDALLKQENKNTPTFMISCMTACQKKSSHRWETQKQLIQRDTQKYKNRNAKEYQNLGADY